MTMHQNIAEWQGKDVVDRDGERIGELEDVYVDVETDEPMFGTVKEGLIGRHLTFVPLAGITIGPDNLQVGGVSRSRSRTPPTSSCTATSFPKRTSQSSIPTTSSTTLRQTRRAVAGSHAADAPRSAPARVANPLARVAASASRALPAQVRRRPPRPFAGVRCS